MYKKKRDEPVRSPPMSFSAPPECLGAASHSPDCTYNNAKILKHSKITKKWQRKEVVTEADSQTKPEKAEFTMA